MVGIKKLKSHKKAVAIDLPRIHARLRSQIFLSDVIRANAAIFIIAIVFFVLTSKTDMQPAIALLVGIAVGSALAILGAFIFSRRMVEPFAILRAGLVHLSPTSSSGRAPQPRRLKLAREATIELLNGVYSLYTYVGNVTHVTDQRDIEVTQLNVLLDQIPVPILVLTKSSEIFYANRNALDLIGRSIEQVEGRPVDLVLPLKKNNQLILRNWLSSRHTIDQKDSVVWRKVPYTTKHMQKYWFDIYAHYSPSHTDEPEVVLLMIDRTAESRLTNSPRQQRRVLDIIAPSNEDGNDGLSKGPTGQKS